MTWRWPAGVRVTWYFATDGWWVRKGRWLLHGLHQRCKPLFTEREGIRPYYRVPFTSWRIRLERETK